MNSNLKYSNLAAEIRLFPIDSKNELYLSILNCLDKHRPVKVLFSDYEDEYSSIAKTLFLKINEVQNEDEMLDVFHLDLIQWFDEEIIGDKKKYSSIAVELYKIKIHFQTNN